MYQILLIAKDNSGNKRYLNFSINKEDNKIMLHANIDGDNADSKAEISLEDFNNFCLNLFNAHKELLK